jgi:hypothetical protein
MKLTAKKFSLAIVIAVIGVQSSFAQIQKTTGAEEGKNLIKLNLGSLFLKTVSVEYERAIHNKISVGLGVRVMPKGSLPFSSSFDSIDDQLGSLELGNIAITPAIKFYMGKGVFKGFYVAPFLRYANYNASINYEFESNNIIEKMPLTGKLNTFTGGVLLGAQWRIAKKVYFDWSIFGPHYGFSSGELVGTKSLTTTQQQDLRDELDGIDLPVGKITSTVNASGATVKVDGPWAGIRGNIGIGYRF